MWMHRPTSYPQILAAIQAQPWAVHESALADFLAVLDRRSSGLRMADGEIESVIQAKARGREETTAPKSIAVLNLFGLIVPRVERLKVSERGVSAEAFDAVFRSAMDDASFGAVVLNIDSPGGAVAGMTELAKTIREYGRGEGGRRKRVVAVINPYAASAAYYIASQADEVVVTPSGEGGSLGVFAVHIDESEALAKDGLKPTLIRAPADGFKAETLGIVPLSPEAKAHLQSHADQALDQFILDVAAGRGLAQSYVREEFGRGRVYNAKEMLERKMVDRIGTFRETLDRLAARIGRGIDVVQQDTAVAAADEGVEKKATNLSPPVLAGRQENAMAEQDPKPPEQAAATKPPDAPDFQAMIQSALAAALAPAVKAAVEDAVKPVAEQVQTLAATSAADAKAARESGLAAQLHQLSQEGRISPGDAKSELKMLLKVDAETAAERLEELSKRRPMPAAMRTPLRDLSGTSEAAGKLLNFSLVPQAIMRENPEGAAQTLEAVELAGGEAAVRKNPRLLLAALDHLGAPIMQRAR